MQYRGRILPLVSLQRILEPENSFSGEEPDPVQVIVFGADERCVGIVVDQILDIVEETVGLRRRGRPRRGLIGSGVVGKRVADFLDLQAVLSAAEEEPFTATRLRRPLCCSPIRPHLTGDSCGINWKWRATASLKPPPRPKWCSGWREKRWMFWSRV